MTTLEQTAGRIRSSRVAAMGMFHVNLTKRQRWLLLLALSATPALAVLLCAVVMGTMMVGPDRTTITWYQQRGRVALAKKDYATARLCYATLLRKRPDDQEYQFGLAQSLAGLGEVGPAMGLVRQLAPEQATGYAPAHLFVARQYMMDPAAADESLSRSEQHLLKVLKSEPKNVEASVLLAGIYAKRKQWDLVGKYLPQGGIAGATMDELAIIGAEAAAERRDEISMEMWAKRAASFYEGKLRTDPKDTQSRLRLAQSYLMIREYQKTVELLESGYNLNQDKDMRRYVAQAIGIWLRNSSTLDAPRRLALLDQGLGWDGQNSLVLAQLMDAKAMDAATLVQPTTQPAAGALSRALALAVAAARASKPDVVRSELANAFAIRPEAALPIAANICTTWAYSKESDAVNSVLLAKTLADFQPGEPVTDRAYGLCLTRTGRFAEALPHLEDALKSMPEDRPLREALAICYERTGKPELAKMHRAATQPATQP